MEKPRFIEVSFKRVYPVSKKDAALKERNEMKRLFDTLPTEACVSYGGSWEVKQQYVGYPNDVCSFCEREFEKGGGE